MTTVPGNSTPVDIPCEGSLARGRPYLHSEPEVLMCSMCGWAFPTNNNEVPQHNRKDIVAMIDRGDFDV